MNGIPKLDALRSISLYGLSSITMNFLYDTDPYFAREQAFERIPDAALAAGRHAPACRRSSARAGSSTGTCSRARIGRPQDLKILDDWVLEPALSRHPGRRRRLGPRRRDDAVSGADRSESPDVVQRHGSADRPAALEQQLERRRRVLFAGRPVLLRARPRPGAIARGHRQHRHRVARRHSRLGQGHRAGDDRDPRRGSASSATCSRTTRSKASS